MEVYKAKRNGTAIFLNPDKFIRQNAMEQRFFLIRISSMSFWRKDI